MDNIHTEYTKPIITVLEPNSSKIYTENEKIQLQINSGGVYPLQKIDVFINDIYLGTLKTPFNFSFVPEELENLRMSNTLRIIAYDTFYNRNESVTSFTVER